VNLSWEIGDDEQDILDAVTELTNIRASYLAEVSSEFFSGEVDLGTKRKDIAWFSLGGREMTDSHWHDGDKRSITVFIEASFNRGLLLLLNSSQEETVFTLPDETWGKTYRCIFDAAHQTSTYDPIIESPSAKVKVAPHCVQVWLISGSAFF